MPSWRIRSRWRARTSALLSFVVVAVAIPALGVLHGTGRLADASAAVGSASLPAAGTAAPA
jgi:hypothetical protein